MKRLLVNTTGAEIFISDIGTVVPASGSAEITHSKASFLQDSDDILPFIASGDIQINNGYRLITDPAMCLKEVQSWGLPETTAFDNTSNGFTATQIQAAIEEARGSSQPLDADLSALAALVGTGVVTRTAANTYALRTILATTPIAISNGDGVAGNPTVSHANSGVSAATYGSASQVPVFAVNATGHVTSVTNTTMVPTNLTYSTVRATNSVSTTSGTFTVVSGMTITPAAGTYLAIFTGNSWVTGGVGTGQGDFAIYVGGSSYAARQMELSVSLVLGLLGTATSRPAGASISDVVTVNGSQAVEVRFSRTNGTVYCGPRALTLLRVV